MRIAVYCSSSPTIDPKFIDLSFELGAAIAQSGAELVSGGGHISSMGAISRGARSKGGRTIGIIPQKLVDIEFADHDSDELIVVDSMRTRKAKIEDLINQGWGAVAKVEANQVPAELRSLQAENKLYTELTKPVSGGRVFSSTLLNIFFADNGDIYAGSVTVERLLAVAQR